MTNCELIEYALSEGFENVRLIAADDIPFDFSFRPYCEANICGNYGTNYSCPPDCGEPEAMKNAVMKYGRALVMQTVWDIPDWRDEKAVKEAKAFHNNAALRLADRLKNEGIPGLVIGCSGCSLCESCAIKEGLSCRYPERRFSCMSAYCIHVSRLCESCGLEYNCGEGKIAFFGMYVFD